MASIRHKYSPTEQRLRALLRPEPKTTEEISRLLYRNREAPYHARKSALVALTSLADKLDLNRDPLRLARTERAGPYPISFWLERR
jgi:hypothetical protein